MKLGDAILYLLLDDTKLKSGLAGAGRQITGWGQTIGKVVTRSLLVATAAIAGLSLGIIKLSKDAAMSAARVEELQLVMEVIGKNAGVSTEKLYENVEAIKDLGITTQVALGLVTQFTRYQLDAADATKLARVAQDAAVISMSDSSEALQGLMHGIVTMNTKVLRTYGITIASTIDLQDDFAESIGKTRGELTQQEKIQSVLEGVLKEGVKIQGAYEAAMESSSKQLRSMKRHVIELLNSLGKPLLGAFGDVVTGATNMLKVFRENIDSGGILETIMTKIGESASNGIGRLLLKGSDFMKGALNFLSFIDHAIKYGEQLDDWFQGIPKAWQPFAQFLAFALDDGDTLNDFLSHLPEKFQKIARVLAELILIVRGQGDFKGLILALFGERGMAGGGPVAKLLKGFEDLGKKIKEFVRTTIQPFIEEHGPEFQKFFDNLAETVIQAFATIAASGVVLKVVGMVMGLLNPLNKIILLIALLKTVWDLNLGGIQEKTAAVVDWLKATWAEWGPVIIGHLTDAWAQIQALFDKYWPLITEAAGKAIQWLKDLWAEHGEEVIARLKSTWETIKLVFQTAAAILLAVVLGVIQGLKNFWEEWGPHIVPLVTAIWETISRIFKNASKIIGNVVSTVLDVITAFWDEWGPTIMTIVENTWEFIKRAFDTAKENLKSIMDLITAVLTGDWETVGQKLREIWDRTWANIKDALETAKENLSTLIKSIVDKMKEKFTNMDWKELGKNIIRGIVEGILSLSHLVGDSLLNIGNSAIDLWDGFWGNKSPSTLMKDRSKNIMDGIRLGAEDEEQGVLASFERMAQNLSNAMAIAATPQAIPSGALGGGGTTHNTEINPSFDFGGTNLGEAELMEAMELLKLIYGGKSYG